MGTHAFFTGGIFHHCPFGRKISFQNSDRTYLFRSFRRSDHILRNQMVIVQVPFSPLKKMILLYRFQIFSQRFSGYCHHIQIQILFQKQLYFRNASCKPEGLGEMLAAGIYVSYMRNV